MPRRAKSVTPPEQTEVATTPRSDRKRVQIDFSSTAYARLEKIRELSDAQSNAETVRNALRLFDWFLHQKQEGYELRMVKGDEERAVELLW